MDLPSKGGTPQFCNFHGERDDKPSTPGWFPNIWRPSHLLGSFLKVNHQTLWGFPSIFRPPNPYKCTEHFVWFHTPRETSFSQADHEKPSFSIPPKSPKQGEHQHVGGVFPWSSQDFQIPKSSSPFGPGALRGLWGLWLGLSRAADGGLRQAAGEWRG